jgi:hypothetical protein
LIGIQLGARIKLPADQGHRPFSALQDLFNDGEIAVVFDQDRHPVGMLKMRTVATDLQHRPHRV